MKKIIITAIISSLIFSFSMTAFAGSETSIPAQTESSMAENVRPVMTAPADYTPEPQEVVTEYRTPDGEQGHGNIKNLEYYYHNNGYPEYLSYIAAYDKMLISDQDIAVCIRAGLTDMSQENMDEILELADSSCYIVFEQASYSYNERTDIYEQLRAEFPELYVSLGYDNESIIIYTPDGKTEACLEALSGRYKGLVYVADDDGVLYDTDVGEPTGERVTMPDGGLGGDTGAISTGPITTAEKDRTAWIIPAAVITALLIAAGAVLLLRKSRIKVSGDGTAAAASTLSKNDVVRLISDSAETPCPELRDRIF